jgi:hypothetical protein
MMELNLLPSRARFQQKKIQLKKKITMFVTGLVSVLTISLVVVGFFWLIASLNLKNQEKRYNTALKDYEAVVQGVATSQDLKYKAKLLGEVLSERFEYGSFIKRIDSFFINNVHIDDYRLAGFEKIKINGTASGDNIEEVEKRVRQINRGEVEGFKSAKIISLQADKGVWKFSMEVNTR